RDFEESVGGLEIDAGYIHAAMVNILDNAVDACLKDKSKDSHKIVFSVRQAESFILFDISDNGIGMKQETVEKLFKLFFSTKGSKGTGFGLFISNQIIQQHGGSISVKSSPNKGTTFTIRIPKILPESAKADSQTI
ncbi:MAG: histidine kinase, partial [Desulfobacteraceae bacterium IS3]